MARSRSASAWLVPRVRPTWSVSSRVKREIARDDALLKLRHVVEQAAGQEEGVVRHPTMDIDLAIDQVGGDRHRLAAPFRRRASAGRSRDRRRSCAARACRRRSRSTSRPITRSGQSHSRRRYHGRAAGVSAGCSVASAMVRAQRGRKPTRSYTRARLSLAIASARSAPRRSRRSISAGSSIRRRISAVIGASFSTARSASSPLKAEKALPGEARLDLGPRQIGQRGVDVEQIRGLGPVLGVIGQAHLAVRFGPLQLERDRVGIVGQIDPGVVRGIRAAHLLASVAQAHDARRLAHDHRLGQREELGIVLAIERAGDVARQLDVLLLVLADRHVGGAVRQDVGGLEHRVDVQAGERLLAVLARLVLELGHAVEPAERRDAVEDPGELGVRRHVALHEDGGVLGIQPGGQEPGRDLVGLGAQLRGLLRHGDRVQVDDAVDRLVLALQAHPVAHRAEIVAEVQLAARLDAGKDPPLHR